MVSQSAPTEVSAFGLTWGLAIATYDRAEVLLQSVRYALQQTRPPIEVVVCDSSDDWATTRSLVEQIVQSIAPTVRVRYGHSPVARQTVQRNIAIDQASADVLFMIDDDAFLHPLAAETILRLYETDKASTIAAIGVADLTSWPPPQSSNESTLPAIAGTDTTRRLVQRILGWHFWARRMSGPEFPLPVANEPVRRTVFLDGYRITVRRSVASQVRFDEHLVSNRFEDADACYRFAQLGAVVMVDRQLIYHAAASSKSAASERQGILSRFGWILNACYLNRKWFGSSLYVRLFCLTHLFRLTPVDILSGLRSGNFGRLRGLLLAIRPMFRLLVSRQEVIGQILVEETTSLRRRLRR